MTDLQTAALAIYCAKLTALHVNDIHEGVDISECLDYASRFLQATSLSRLNWQSTSTINKLNGNSISFTTIPSKYDFDHVSDTGEFFIVGIIDGNSERKFELFRFRVIDGSITGTILIDRFDSRLSAENFAEKIRAK